MTESRIYKKNTFFIIKLES